MLYIIKKLKAQAFAQAFSKKQPVGKSNNAKESVACTGK